MTRETAGPLPGRLSHGTIVSGPAPAARRAAKPASSLAGAVTTGAVRSPCSVAMSAVTSGRVVSSPPSLPRTYPASVTVVVMIWTCGSAK